MNFIHYDVKAMKKKEKNFKGLFQHAEIACSEIQFLHVHRKEVKLQRGVIRTNCIDSLDRTNFAQEMFGYFVALK